MVSGGMTCVKYLLFCFNLLFVLSGIIILTVGALVQAAYYKYTDLVDPSYVTAPKILIVVGVIVFIVAFFGCCGAVRENHCMITSFAVLLLIIFAMELGAGIAGYMHRNEVDNIIADRLNKSLSNYTTNNEIRSSWDAMQHDLSCCGVNEPSDWTSVLNSPELPSTCCTEIINNQPCTLESTSLVKKGCYPALKEFVVKNSDIIAYVGIGVALIQLFGVVFACCLARSIRREYETV